MKIQKYQYGASYTPISREVMGQSQGEPATSPSSEKKDDKLIEQEIIKVLGENGIPTDVDYFLSQAQSFLQDSTNIFSGKKTNTMSQLIRLRSLANRLQHNNALYKNATDRIKVENTGSDVAISNDGNLYVYDGESVKKVTPTDYSKNPEEYQVLTNAELIHLRERDPNLKFDESILHDLSNSIGMKTIMDQVIGTIKKFGTTSQKGYTIKAGGQVQRGLEALMSLDGLYEVESSDSKAAQDINAAIIYLYKNLNNNAKHVLRATTAAEGLNPENMEDITSILKAALSEHTDTSKKVGYVKNPLGKGSKSGSGEGSGPGDKEGYGQSLISGFGASRTRRVRTRDGIADFTVEVKHNPLRDKDNEIVTGIATLDEVFNDLAKNGVAMDRDKLYFGGMYNAKGTNGSVVGDSQDTLYIDPNKAREVLVDASDGVETIDVPVDYNGKPDFGAINRYQMAVDEISKNKVTDPREIFEIYKKYALDNNLDQDGNLMTGRFLAVHAKMSEDEGAVAGYSSDNPTIDRLTGQGRDKFMNDVNYANQGREKKNKVKINYGWIWNRGILSGTVFIPLYVNQASQAVSDERARTDKRTGSEYQMMQEAYVDPRYNNGVYNPRQTKLQTSFGDL